MTSREIVNDKKFRQMHLFNGLQHDKKSPTDLDFCYEIDNTVLILGEVKEEGKEVPTGQTLAYTRICDAWEKSHNKKCAWYLEIQHPEQKGDIVIADCQVVRYYYMGIWSKSNQTVQEFLGTIGHYMVRSMNNPMFSWLTQLEDKMNG